MIEDDENANPFEDDEGENTGNLECDDPDCPWCGPNNDEENQTSS